MWVAAIADGHVVLCHTSSFPENSSIFRNKKGTATVVVSVPWPRRAAQLFFSLLQVSLWFSTLFASCPEDFLHYLFGFVFAETLPFQV
jgi:hypothetical protein